MENNVDEATVRLVQMHIASAGWRLSLDKFLEKLGEPDDDYWREKFREFQELARKIDDFDAATLYKIIAP